MEENKEVFIPEPLSDALFDSKLTPKQRKFILLLVEDKAHEQELHRFQMVFLEVLML